MQIRALPSRYISRNITEFSQKKAPTSSVGALESERDYWAVVDVPMLAVLVPSVTSAAVTVQSPGVLNVTLNVCEPSESAASAGSVAEASLLVMVIVSVELTMFQSASTALTVTLNGMSESCASGVPALPVGVLGAFDSPGIKT